MQAVELAIQIAMGLAKAVPVIKSDLQAVGKDTDVADKLRDALKAAKDAVDALEAAING